MTRKIDLHSSREALELFGQFDENLRLLEKSFPVRILARGDHLLVKGKNGDVHRASLAIEKLLARLRSGNSISRAELPPPLEGGSSLDRIQPILVTDRGKPIIPRTEHQKQYLSLVEKNDLVIAIGPAGTGKTYLAVASALAALRNGRVSRVVLSRPVVEAGEKLGFLPGDFAEKVDPYLRPLYDAFYSMLGPHTFSRMKEDGTVEIAPLAYMRGRTLDDAFIILDEAQNTTVEQMKMFLTRMGEGSKAVATGDITQIDLGNKKTSGLVQTAEILKKVPGIAFVTFSNEDVLRHALVKRIVAAWESWEKR